MKIAAYQFAVSSDIRKNMTAIENAVREAKSRGVELLVFPECALTGYPPRDLASSKDVDRSAVKEACKAFSKLSDETGVAFVVGLIEEDHGRIYNRASCFIPGKKRVNYDKRALWGWDRDNFAMGEKDGIFTYKGFKIGMRICFEVRFPEYFRELYRRKTDLDIVLFYDVTDADDPDRYYMISGHLQTRAVENVCPILSANTIAPNQTAPTVLFGKSGQKLIEAERGREGLIEYDLPKTEDNFGEKGRREISDLLI